MLFRKEAMSTAPMLVLDTQSLLSGISLEAVTSQGLRHFICNLGRWHQEQVDFNGKMKWQSVAKKVGTLSTNLLSPSASLCHFRSLFTCFYTFVVAVDVALSGLERWPLAEALSSVPSTSTKRLTNHQASILVLGFEQFYFTHYRWALFMVLREQLCKRLLAFDADFY